MANAILSNNRYRLEAAPDGGITITVAGMPPQKLRGDFTVIQSDTDSGFNRSPVDHNYLAAPRDAVRWRDSLNSIETLNAWFGSPAFRAATGATGTVRAAGTGRVWEYRDDAGKIVSRVTGKEAMETADPFAAGTNVAISPQRAEVQGDTILWHYASGGNFDFAAQVRLPPGDADPVVTYAFTPHTADWFSVAFTGAEAAKLQDTKPIPSECDSRGHKLFNFVMSEPDLHLPRVQVSTAGGNTAITADPAECRFRLPTGADSRFGAMLELQGDMLKPVFIAPLLGGAESRMKAGTPWSFSFRYIVQAGDWKKTYAHIACDIHGLRDLRDNSGPGSLNGTLARIINFLNDHSGANYAMWDPQQKYYDYFTDKTGIFKPFSPLYGLSAAIVTDDEDFFRKRGLPALEFALSRRTNVFPPYDAADNKQADTAKRSLGGPYINSAQLLSLHELLQNRTPAIQALAATRLTGKKTIADALADWRLTGNPATLEEARSLAAGYRRADAQFSEASFFDLVDLAEATRNPEDIAAARKAAYSIASDLNLYPEPPDKMVTVDRGGHAPVHQHSFTRHKNIWGYPVPQPLAVPEQTVPAWRIARIGVSSPAYPMEYWMNTQGALLRVAGLTNDPLLRDVARWGMIGRFGNYPGDNRSVDSLVAESPDAVEHRPWDWNFATVNPGHAWDFVNEVIDFLVSETFDRSAGAIDFPAVSAAGSNFRTRIYGAKPGVFFGDHNVTLWLPNDLLDCDNRQINWTAGYGNGCLYLALCNESAQAEKARIHLNPLRARANSPARTWKNNAPAQPLEIRDNAFAVDLPAKSLVALAIPATVTPRLQAKLYAADSAPLGPHSFANVDTPFGPVHAMLLRAGRNLTSAFLYAEALPENVIAARLFWRQGNTPWKEMTDEIYPYEFSPELSDDGGDFQAVFQVENAQGQLQQSPVIDLAMGAVPQPPAPSPLPEHPVKITLAPAAKGAPADLDPDFLSYLENAANGDKFGLREDGRFYPYSTPLGRRVGWRQPVWDIALYAKGCMPEEAAIQLRINLGKDTTELQSLLSSRPQPASWAQLDKTQREMLLDFANSEGTAHIPPALVDAVLNRDWKRLINDHLYVRYAGHAPDHVRNKAFLDRWSSLIDPS